MRSLTGNIPPLRGIVRAGLVAIVAAVVANLVALVIVRAVTDLPSNFPPLQFGPIAIFTAIGVALGVIVFAIISRAARQPARTFRIVALIALLVSLVPNILLMINPTAAPVPGGSTPAFGMLMIFHVIAALVSVPVLMSLLRR
jgi:uncharacterized membrane protein YozB (DUF420 family)